jgi:hypothetical protein
MNNIAQTPLMSSSETISRNTERVENTRVTMWKVGIQKGKVKLKMSRITGNQT